jgi:hypothetical protein
MKTGMLWFDNDPKIDLQAKIARAAEYYRKKYGINPDLCFVHPSMINVEIPPRNGIEVRTTKLVLPNHLWIGKHEAPVLV